MTKTEKSKLSAKAEACMMGYGQRVSTREETVFILDYIAKTLGLEDDGKTITENALQYCDSGAYICAVIASRVSGDIMLTLPIGEDRNGESEPFVPDPDNGNLCYVYNASAPWCSELGYSGIQILNGKLRRCW